MSVTTLYRFYDGEERLLYVGISERGPERWRAHRKDKPWWTDVARTTTEHYDTRAEALDAERAAIVAEKPLHNVVHNGGRVKRDERSTPKRNANDKYWIEEHDWPEKLIHQCAYCDNLIESGDGYVWTDRRWQRPNWIPTHRRCDPWIDTTGYWIAVERIRTQEEYDNWVDHLKSKWWFEELLFSDVLLDNREWWRVSGFINERPEVRH